MKVEITYGGETATLHPELGLLEPGETREISPRDLPAAFAAEGAGLPLRIVVTVDRESEASTGDAPPETSVQDPGPPAEADEREE